MDPIRIEQYANYEDDRIRLWEITDLNVDRLMKLDKYLTMTTVPLDRDFAEFHKALKKLISSIDVAKAS